MRCRTVGRRFYAMSGCLRRSPRGRDRGLSGWRVRRIAHAATRARAPTRRPARATCDAGASHPPPERGRSPRACSATAAKPRPPSRSPTHRSSAPPGPTSAPRSSASSNAGGSSGPSAHSGPRRRAVPDFGIAVIAALGQTRGRVPRHLHQQLVLPQVHHLVGGQQRPLGLALARAAAVGGDVEAAALHVAALRDLGGLAQHALAEPLGVVVDHVAQPDLRAVGTHTTTVVTPWSLKVSVVMGRCSALCGRSPGRRTDSSAGTPRVRRRWRGGSGQPRHGGTGGDLR